VVDNGDRNGATVSAGEQSVVISEQDISQHGMSEHGRGLKIIDAVTDELSLKGSGPAGTTVHFEKVLNWIPGALAEQLSAAGR
jgi:anti-sigma regulatory factor (Ser/Thr protein kinase)